MTQNITVENIKCGG
ncbi:MAG TPA: hypothetical protein PLP27_08160, partial [Crocinitomicaceae bacterium]|nr:hypothetical protein [Crocinitomicaceae bacterium]